MKIIFDVLKFVNKVKDAVFLSSEDEENLIRIRKVVTNFFQDVNSKKLGSNLENVRMLGILSAAGDWCTSDLESSKIIEILCEDIKGLHKEYRIKNIQNEN